MPVAIERDQAVKWVADLLLRLLPVERGQGGEVRADAGDHVVDVLRQAVADVPAVLLSEQVQVFHREYVAKLLFRRPDGVICERRLKVGQVNRNSPNRVC